MYIPISLVQLGYLVEQFFTLARSKLDVNNVAIVGCTWREVYLVLGVHTDEFCATQLSCRAVLHPGVEQT